MMCKCWDLGMDSKMWYRVRMYKNKSKTTRPTVYRCKLVLEQFGEFPMLWPCAEDLGLGLVVLNIPDGCILNRLWDLLGM